MLGTRIASAAGGFIAPGIAFALLAASFDWMPDQNVARWGVVFVAALLSCIVLLWARLDRVDFAAASFAAWCCASVAWSPDRLASLDAATKVVAVALVFMALRRLGLRWVVPAAVIGLMVGSTYGAPYGGLGNPEFYVWFALIAIPLVATMHVVGFVCAAFLGLVSLGLMSEGVLIPLTLGILTPLLVRTWWVRLGVVSALAAGTVLLWRLSSEVANGIGTRLDLFAGTIAAWLTAPVTGHGIGTFLYVFPSYAGTGARFGLVPYVSVVSTYANAAHNDFLQLLMEVGVVGAALAAWAVYEVWACDAKALGPRLALLIAGALCLTGFPLQLPATALLVALAAARVSPSSPLWTWRAAPLAVAGALAMFAMVVAIPARVMAQAHLSATARYYEPAVLNQRASSVAALSHALQAYELDPSDPHTRLAVFQTMALTYVRFPGSTSRAAVDEAWRIANTASPSDPLLLLTRLQVLLAADECFGSAECHRIAGELVRTASRKREVRKLIEVYGSKT